MKATNNNTDTLFMDIFVELFAIAKVYFQELFKNADPGTYTMKDIYSFIEKNIEATKQGKLTGVNPYFSDRYVKTLKKSPYYTKVDSFEKYTISYFCRVTDNVVSIEKENFKCSFDIIKVFEYLERFKKLSGAKDKLEFTKETEVKEGQNITSFEIELSKEIIKSLTSVKTEKKDIVGRYTENTAHLSLSDSMIYSTNCHVLKAKQITIKNLFDETKDILIPFDVLKNIGAGKHEFSVIENEEVYKVVIKNTTTNKITSYSFQKQDRFYNYKAIYPELYKEMNICLKDTKSFVDCIKTQQKACGNFGLSYFMLQVIKGSKEIKVITCNEVDCIGDNHKFSEFSFELKESAEFSRGCFYAFDKILKCLNDWNSNLYFDETKLSFGMKAVDICFCVGALDINKFFDKYSTVTIKPDKLTKIENDIVSEQKSKVLKPGENETRLSAQSEKESSLNGKERDETKQIEKDSIKFLPETDRNAYNVCENNECTFILKPKEISVIDYIRIGKGIIKDDPIKVVGISGQKYFISFDGESVGTSLFHSNINVRLKEAEEIFDYLEEGGWKWEQPDTNTFYLIAEGKEYTFNNEIEAYLYLNGGEVQPKEAKGKFFELSEEDKENFDVMEYRRNFTFLKPKKEIAIINICTKNKIQNGERFTVSMITGTHCKVIFNGIDIVSSIKESGEYKKKYAELCKCIIFYLERDGYKWKQLNTDTFCLILDSKEFMFNNMFEAYLFVEDKSVEPKEIKEINDNVSDDMLELVSLDLNSMTYTVNRNIGTGKDITSIILYDKIGKIVVFFNDGEKRECQFDGESILQSVLKEVLYTNK